jgi:predicted  nucleic acid-binding Zn-ribbon protein
MKWLKGYKLFLEQDEATPLGDDVELSDNNDKLNQESLKMIQKDISEFKSKKGVLEDIFKDVDKSDTDIEDELLSKVYSNKKNVDERNKYLKSLEGVYRLKRSVDKISMAIEDDNSKKLRTEKQLNELRDRFNEVDNESQKAKISDQIEKSRDYLKRINDNISENKKKYSEMDKKWDEKKKEFENMMKIEEERIKKLI